MVVCDHTTTDPHKPYDRLARSMCICRARTRHYKLLAKHGKNQQRADTARPCQEKHCQVFLPPRMKNAYGTGTSIKKSETLYSPHCLVKECSKIVLDCKYSKKKVYTEFFRHVFRLPMHYYNIFLQFAFSCKCGPLTVLTLKNTSRHPMPADMHTSGSQPQPTIKPGCETACLPMRNGLFRMSEQAVSQCAGCLPVGRCNH